MNVPYSYCVEIPGTLRFSIAFLKLVYNTVTGTDVYIYVILVKSPTQQ